MAPRLVSDVRAGTQPGRKTVELSQVRSPGELRPGHRRRHPAPRPPRALSPHPASRPVEELFPLLRPSFSRL